MIPGGSPRGFIILAILILTGLGAWTSYYTVPSDSVAVVQRTGAYLKEVPPGLHFKLPLGIDEATIVPIKRQLKQEFGFTTPGARDPYQSARSRNRAQKTQKRETQMVTGDLNAALVEWVVQYSIDQVQLKNINPPEPVQESFNEVNQAQQEKEKLINEARRDYNKVIPLAEGEKDQRIREADGYRLKRINEAQGDVARFSSLLAEYTKAPEVTMRRIYIETLQDVMPSIRSKIIVDEATRGILPFLNLDSQNLVVEKTDAPKKERP